MKMRNSVSRRFFVIVLSLIIIYNSGSVLITVNNEIGFIAILIGLFLIIVLKWPGLIVFRRDIAGFLFASYCLAFLISLFANFNKPNLQINIRYIAVISFSYLIFRLVSFSAFINYYRQTLTFLCLVSLAFYIAVNLFKVKINFHIITNVNNVSYYNGLIFYTYTYLTTRNIGVFWEPGIFSSFIAFGLLFEVVYQKKSSLTVVFIYAITIFTTYSTAGYALLILVLTTSIQKWKNATFKYLIVLMAITCIVLISVNIYEVLQKMISINPFVFEKIAKGTESVSVLDRLQSPAANFKLFLSKPFWGNGLGKVDLVYHSITESAQTSTSMFYLAAFGILGGVPTIVLAASILSRKSNIVFKVLELIILLLIVNKEPHIFFVLTYIVFFYLSNENCIFCSRRMLLSRNVL